MSQSQTYEPRQEGEDVDDEAALLASGERLADMPELVALLGVSATTIQRALNLPDAPRFRYLSRTRESPTRYCISDVMVAVESRRRALRERQRRAEVHRDVRAAVEAAQLEPCTRCCKGGASSRR